MTLATRLIEGRAETRARLRTGEIRIFDSTGNVVIAFDEAIGDCE
jgi:hypothetical protein